MKTSLLFLTLVLATPTAYAQQTLPPLLPEPTNLEEFSARSGIVIEREFTRIGEFANLRVDVVKVTDLMAKVTAQGVRISGATGPDPSRDAAFVDADEIDMFIRAIRLMKTVAFSTTPDSFTDVAYRTRGGIAIGAFYANKRWNPYLRLDRYDPRTSVNIDQNEFESLRDLLTQAKERIK